jgi:hypothetical protein
MVKGLGFSAAKEHHFFIHIEKKVLTPILWGEILKYGVKF